MKAAKAATPKLAMPKAAKVTTARVAKPRAVKSAAVAVEPVVVVVLAPPVASTVPVAAATKAKSAPRVRKPRASRARKASLAVAAVPIASDTLTAPVGDTVGESADELTQALTDALTVPADADALAAADATALTALDALDALDTLDADDVPLAARDTLATGGATAVSASPARPLRRLQPAARPLPARAPTSRPSLPEEPSVLLDLAEPPETYGLDAVGLLARDPGTLFAYWEITNATRATAPGELVLRLRAHAAGHTQELTIDHPLGWNHGRRYLPAPASGAQVTAVLGVRGPGGAFTAVAWAPTVRVPPAAPDAEVAAHWVEVPRAESRGLHPEPPAPREPQGPQDSQHAAPPLAPSAAWPGAAPGATSGTAAAGSSPSRAPHA
ncbi:MAG: DUF4912 domain-containing protein [Myxococcales bacterium]|nr:DUF4912 domain-containing protein [Myxococcales bacterium]